MRKILKDANIPILKDHSIHHKLPIAAGENDPLIKGAIELDGYDINNAANLEQLPRNSAARSESLASKNRQFKSEVQQELMAEDKILRKAFDSQGIFWVCD
jgi:hypothetical protein